ncbi:MAG TPA: protease complex subunit PrcB family protein [Thermoanaerobaculia bacterium]
MKHVLTLFLLVLGACASSQATNPAMTIRRVAEGQHSVLQRERHDAIAVFSQQSYAEAWTRYVGTGEAPAVDFTKDFAVFLLAGQRPTGGYTIEPRSVSIDRGELLVNAPVRVPDGITAQVISYPWAVIAIPLPPDAARPGAVRWNP